MSEKHPFIIKKVSDYGAKNPIVARLSVQSYELMRLFFLDEKRRDEVYAMLYGKVQPRLLTCMEIVNAISSEILSIRNDILNKKSEIQSRGHAITLPQVMKLREQIESFLYCAKLVLRDLSNIFEPFYGIAFNKARYDKIYSWAKKQFGENDELTKIIKRDYDLWIKKLIDMRNAVEHPGEHSGTLDVHNFELLKISDSEGNIIAEPTWHLDDQKPTSIVKDKNVYLHNLLEFSEDLLVICLKSLIISFQL